MIDNQDSISERLERVKKRSPKGGEYWMARDIQPILGYSEWRNFEAVIHRAVMACESGGVSPSDHFVETARMVPIGSGAQRDQSDFFLTRYACYLVAMNGDTAKAEVGAAQAYFAVQTRRMEVQDRLSETERRLELRGRVKSANKALNSAAKAAGVQKYAVFHDAGYRGLYGMGLSKLKERKRIPPSDDLLDRAGRAELAANEFRITQTEQKLVRDRVRGEHSAVATHEAVGQQVRATIKKLGGTLPEDLPAEPSIKALTKKRRPRSLTASNRGESEG